MAQEKEIKLILKIGMGEFAERVHKHGFLMAQPVKQQDLYFDTQDLRLYRTAACLRIRSEDGIVGSLDFKKLFYIQDFGWFVDERSWRSPPIDISVFLCHLGYRQFANVKKTRQAFVKDGVEVCIDNVEGVGVVVEVEGKHQDPQAVVDSLLEPSEWERTVEGTSDLWLKINKGLTEHLTFPDRFRADPDWNVEGAERDWYEHVKGESVGT